MHSGTEQNQTNNQGWINYLNAGGLNWFGAFWLPQYYFGLAPFVLAQAPLFANMEQVADVAEANEGVCSFFDWQTYSMAIMQAKNKSFVPDELLAPLTAAGDEIYGPRWIGTVNSKDDQRLQTRKAIEMTIDNQGMAMRSAPQLVEHTKNYLQQNKITGVDLQNYCYQLVGYVNSMTKGIFDLTDKPINKFLETDPFLQDFVKNAAVTIQRGDAQFLEDFLKDNNIIGLSRRILKANKASLNAAEETNLFKRFIRSFHEIDKFTDETIDAISDTDMKGIGAMLANAFDTTAATLLWVICRIEDDPQLKEQVLQDAQAQSRAHGELSTIDLVVLEAMRFDSIIPSPLFRTMEKAGHGQFDNGRAFFLPVGTRVYQDRHRANCDPDLFSNPNQFDIENIRGLANEKGFKAVFDFFGNQRQEINTFSGVNTRAPKGDAVNPTVCPARHWVSHLLTQITREIYKNCEVSLANGSSNDRDKLDLSLRPGEALRLPNSHPQLTLTPRDPSQTLSMKQPNKTRA